MITLLHNLQLLLNLPLPTRRIPFPPENRYIILSPVFLQKLLNPQYWPPEYRVPRNRYIMLSPVFFQKLLNPPYWPPEYRVPRLMPCHHSFPCFYSNAVKLSIKATQISCPPKYRATFFPRFYSNTVKPPIPDRQISQIKIVRYKCVERD